MNTKPIPAIIVLLAAGISCVASILQQVNFAIFTKRLFFSVLVFFIIGFIIKIALDKCFPIKEVEEDTEEQETEGIEVEEVKSEEQYNDDNLE